ncbi:SDR family NAD(P)-dependent oxidoreductase, partial [Mycobacterium sp. NAZ190054]|uniref:SDR family NAD(P)-dependent oxidoreductase n=1 Tax=Mycobacterium sp. NAZ190054 TaxID=1747766 RepID=UPI000B14AE78
ESFRDVIDINLTGTWNTVMAGAQHIIDGDRGGSIILISSAAGGVPVPFSDLLAPHFYKTPELLFSADMFHPSAAGYELAAMQLLPALCEALGEFVTGAPTAEALESRTDDDASLLSRLGGLNRLWRRSTGVPAPIVVPAG